MTILAPKLIQTLLQVRIRKGLHFLSLATNLSNEVITRALAGLDVAPEVATLLKKWSNERLEEVEV